MNIEYRLILACIVVVATALALVAIGRLYYDQPIPRSPAGWACPPNKDINVLEIFASPSPRG
jgi:hypothetical protein